MSLIVWLCSFRLLSRLLVPFLVHKVPRTKNSGFWIPIIHVFASFNLLLSTVVDYRSFCYPYYFFFFMTSSTGKFSLMTFSYTCYNTIGPCSMQVSFNFLKFKKRHWWQSCYVWAGFSQLLLLLQSFKSLFIFSFVKCLFL